MVHWRCVNNPFGYCKGKPQTPTGELPDGSVGWTYGLTCVKNPTTCGKYQTATEHYTELSANHAEQCKGDSYRHIVVAEKPEKPKRKKKEEASA